MREGGLGIIVSGESEGFGFGCIDKVDACAGTIDKEELETEGQRGGWSMGGRSSNCQSKLGKLILNCTHHR
jgi:hypothetical protein